MFASRRAHAIAALRLLLSRLVSGRRPVDRVAIAGAVAASSTLTLMSSTGCAISCSRGDHAIVARSGDRSELQKAFRLYQTGVQQGLAPLGPYMSAVLDSAQRLGAQAELLGESHQSASALLELLSFADFAHSMGEEAATGIRTVSDMAAELHARFVSAVADEKGLPESFASAARNAVCAAFAYPLMGQGDVEILAGVLRAQGIKYILDPMAGTGFQAHLLQKCGFNVIASDAKPAARLPGGVGWFPTDQRLICEVDWGAHSAATAMLLSWPPRWTRAGVEALEHFQGEMVIVIGDRGQWNGDEAFHKRLESSWTKIWKMQIEKWPRMEDDVRVYKRS